jgi:hypothetical protein
MKKQSQTEALKEAISVLENRQKKELELLKVQFQLTKDSFKSMNLIKNTLHEISTSPDLRNILLNNFIGVSTGCLSKRILVGTSHNVFKKSLGAFVQFAVANVVANHAETLISVGKNIFSRIQAFRKTIRPQKNVQENDKTFFVSSPLGIMSSVDEEVVRIVT